MFNIKVWKGNHSKHIYDLIEETLLCDDQLLILCPPRVESIDDFINCLPSGEVSFYGELSHHNSFLNKSDTLFSEYPKFALFSSGTTSDEQKMILYTNDNILKSNEGILSFFSDDRFDNIFCYPQPYHIFGLALGYVLAITKKLKLKFEDGPYSKKSHESWLNETNLNGDMLLTLGTPTHFSDLISETQSQNINQSLTCIIGGAAVTKKMWENVKNSLHISKPSIGYGCSEASPGLIHLAPGIVPLDDCMLGKTLPCVDLDIGTNSVTARGENVCLAVIQAGDITFNNNVIYINDILSCSEDGFYKYIGRSDFIINRGGEKFSVEEIELSIKKELGINCVVTYCADERLGSELCFVMMLEDELKSRSLFQFLELKYKRRFKNDNIIFLKDIPINENQKIDRSQCFNMFNVKSRNV
jgi:acyl-CoA synthetase (AMP-forming)/AMP-acid ligase II